MKTFMQKALVGHQRLHEATRMLYRVFTGFYIRQLFRFVAVLRHIYQSHDVRVLTDRAKRRHILELCDGDYSILIESGTFLGESTEYFATHVQQVYTIEVSDTLYQRARDRLARLPNVEVIHGDSGVVLESLLVRIDEPCVIFLDGHYSGGVTSHGAKKVPIYEELHHVFSHPVKNHLVVIDDARCFIGADGYPRLSDLQEFIRATAGDDHYKMSIDNDLIILTEPGLPPSQWAVLTGSS
jgi:hypothetical protein